MYARDAIWVEKYRPESLDEVRGNEKEIWRLQEWVDDPAMPNVMLHGPQGTGKTAAAVAFCKVKYGEDWRNHLLQLNASDDRGIDVVRKQVKKFASEGGVMGGHGYNIVLLDEVDHMTRQAQPAMRRIMEDYSDRTRFFLLCNYPKKLIDPILSRCATLKISPLDDDQIFDLLAEIASEEELEYDDDQLQRIVGQADGDARAAIHTLQSSVIDKAVHDDALDAIVTVIDGGEVEEIIDMALNGDMDNAMNRFDDLIAEGIGAQQIANEMDRVVADLDLPQDSKSLLYDKTADFEWRVVNGATPEIQGHSLLQDLRVARHVSLPNYQAEAPAEEL